MADRAVLINGLPASGKTTLGAALATELDWAFLSKDAFKEALGDAVWPHVSSDRLGGIALETMYALAAEIDDGVVLDAIWLSTRDRHYLDAGLATMGGPRVIEVWCELPEALAHLRFDARQPTRHEMHGAWRPGYWKDARPITENPLRVDMSRPVDAATLAERVRTALTPSARSR